MTAHDSEDTHLGYESAKRTLCLSAISNHRAIRDDGEKSGCEICNETLRLFRLAGVENGSDRCPAKTRAGYRCVRDPRPGFNYCPSHSYLEPQEPKIEDWMYETQKVG